MDNTGVVVSQPVWLLSPCSELVGYTTSIFNLLPSPRPAHDSAPHNPNMFFSPWGIGAWALLYWERKSVWQGRVRCLGKHWDVVLNRMRVQLPLLAVVVYLSPVCLLGSFPQIIPVSSDETSQVILLTSAEVPRCFVMVLLLTGFP